MSLVIKDSFISFLLRLLIAVFIGKIATFPLYFLLPHQGREYYQNFDLDLFYIYKVDRAFDIGVVKSKKRPKVVYQLTNISLKAVYTTGNKGVIVIEDRGKIVLLGVGEEYKGYKLIKVLPYKAIFERASKQYEIRMKIKNLTEKAQFSLQEHLLFDDVQQVFALTKRTVESYKKNLRRLWQEITIKEILDKKTKALKGFRIERIKKGSIFDKIGLQKGDIIIGTNNKIFKSYADVVRIYSNIEKYNGIKLMILRNDQKKEIEYEFY